MRNTRLSLPEVARNVIQGLHAGYDFILTNFANGDVIGHTANTQAKIECARAVDRHLSEVVENALHLGYVVAVTADHGNLELMLTDEGKPHVAHTTNQVPFILIDPHASQPLALMDGSLRDIAPTLLNILDLPVPQKMTGLNLAQGHSWGQRRKTLLIILDGWGNGQQDQTNPIHLAPTPAWDELVARCGMARLQAAGTAVGAGAAVGVAAPPHALRTMLRSTSTLTILISLLRMS